MVGTLDDPRGGYDSPVFAHARRVQPGVSVPSSPLVMVMGVGLAAMLGLVVFLTMQSTRQAKVRQAEQAFQAANPPYVPPPPAPMIVVPPTPEPGMIADAMMTPPAFVPAMSAMQVAPGGPDQTRYRAPAMVVDFSGNVSGTAPAASLPGPMAAPAPRSAPDEKMSAEERFAARVAGTQAETATASRLSNPSRVAPQGTIIPAVLETAINSDLPGYTRAVVSRDVKAFDGVRVVIPRGSKLIGEYRSGVATGQSRAFVVWSRILTPDGVSIDIGSPGADRLGRGGLQGETDTHFFRRFGSSILLSVLSAGMEAAANNNRSGNTAIIIGSPQQAASVAQVALQKEIDIPPTIKVPQGEPIRVFVARDLDFSTAGR